HERARAWSGAKARRGGPDGLPHRGTDSQERPLTDHGPDPESHRDSLARAKASLISTLDRIRPRTGRAVVQDEEDSVEPWVVGDVLDGNHSLDLSPADFGHCFLPERVHVVVAEDVLGSGGQHQPRPLGQLALELAGAPSGMTDVINGLAVVRGGQG